MNKRIILAAMAAVVAIAFVWSVSTFATPKVADGGQEASAPISPHGIMVKQGNSLPVEYWAHPY
jgi:hypothetical protein